MVASAGCRIPKKTRVNIQTLITLGNMEQSSYLVQVDHIKSLASVAVEETALLIKIDNLQRLQDTGQFTYPNLNTYT